MRNSDFFSCYKITFKLCLQAVYAVSGYVVYYFAFVVKWVVLIVLYSITPTPTVMAHDTMASVTNKNVTSPQYYVLQLLRGTVFRFITSVAGNTTALDEPIFFLSYFNETTRKCFDEFTPASLNPFTATPNYSHVDSLANSLTLPRQLV